MTYIGEIQIVAFDLGDSSRSVAPRGWALCNGEDLPINQFQKLYSYLGDTFGGSANHFKLPDFRGRVPMCMGTSENGTVYKVGNKGGEENVVLTQKQVPAHSHKLVANTLSANSKNPQNAILGVSTQSIYSNAHTNTQLKDDTIAKNQGGDVGHPNIQSSLGLNFIISLDGSMYSKN